MRYSPAPMLGLPQFPRTFWILWAGELIDRLGGFVLPLLALYLTEERGLAVEEVGLVVALWGAGSLAASSLSGWLSDRIGRRRTLIIALIAGAASMLHLAFAQAPAHVAVAAFLAGLCGQMYRAPLYAAVADVVPEDRRASAYGVLYWAANIGFAVGSALGGALSKRGWWLLFVGDAATTLIYAAIVWLRVPETRPEHPPGHERQPPWAPLSDRPFTVFVVLITLVWISFHQ